jgi:hypothetical protein
LIIAERSNFIFGKAMAPQEKKNILVASSAEALLTMMLHSVKHSHLPVHGLLLGSFDTAERKVQVREAIPVCRGAPTQPLVETALALIEAMTDSSVVGWYTGPGLLKDDRPGPAALKIVSGLVTGNESKEPVLLVIRNETLEQVLQGEEQSVGKAIKALGKDFGKQWLDPLDVIVDSQPNTAKALREAVQGGLLVEDLVDHFVSDAKGSKWYFNDPLRRFVEEQCSN